MLLFESTLSPRRMKDEVLQRYQNCSADGGSRFLVVQVRRQPLKCSKKKARREEKYIKQKGSIIYLRRVGR